MRILLLLLVLAPTTIVTTMVAGFQPSSRVSFLVKSSSTSITNKPSSSMVEMTQKSVPVLDPLVDSSLSTNLPFVIGLFQKSMMTMVLGWTLATSMAAAVVDTESPYLPVSQDTVATTTEQVMPQQQQQGVTELSAISINELAVEALSFHTGTTDFFN
jgi:hypothetical protein